MKRRADRGGRQQMLIEVKARHLWEVLPRAAPVRARARSLVVLNSTLGGPVRGCARARAARVVLNNIAAVDLCRIPTVEAD